MYFRPYFCTLVPNIPPLVAMNGGLTADEDSPGSNTALGSGLTLRLCVRVMSACVDSPCPWPAVD